MPVRLSLSPGRAGDAPQVPALLGGLSPAVVIADIGYDADAVVARGEVVGAKVVIPSHARRSIARPLDRERYKDRNLAGRFWAHAKQYWRVAPRYDKTARACPARRAKTVTASSQCLSILGRTRRAGREVTAGSRDDEPDRPPP